MSKIIITIGHGKADNGGYDSGAISKDGKYHEYRIAKEIGKYAQQYYNSHYSEQCDLMNYDGNITLQGRINRLQDHTYDFICEMHLNAGGGTGTEVYYSNGSSKGKKYAKAISEAISKEFGFTNRGAKTMTNPDGSDYLGIIRATVPEAVLVENAFIDNNSDLAKVKTAEGQKKCGIAIAKAIASVRGLKKSTSTKKKTTAKKETTPSKEKSTSYRVKVSVSDLNIRKGAGTNYATNGVIAKGVYTITAEKAGKGSAKGWGKLKSGAGWISLDYVKKIK